MGLRAAGVDNAGALALLRAAAARIAEENLEAGRHSTTVLFEAESRLLASGSAERSAARAGVENVRAADANTATPAARGAAVAVPLAMGA